MQIADRRALWRKYRAIWHEPVECPSEMSRNEFNQQVDDILIVAFGPEPKRDEMDDGWPDYVITRCRD